MARISQTPYRSGNIFDRSFLLDVSPEPAADEEQMHTITVNLPDKFRLEKPYQDYTFNTFWNLAEQELAASQMTN